MEQVAIGMVTGHDQKANQAANLESQLESLSSAEPVAPQTTSAY